MAVIYAFENFELDTATVELRCDGVVVRIEPQVFRLLRLLVENRERVVSKDEIIEKIWQGRIVSEAAMTSRISSTRSALGDDGKKQRLIRTIHGQGLRFVGNVEAKNEHTPEKAPGPEPLDLPDQPSIAVLAFDNMSGDPEQQYLSDGIAEDITTALSRINWLFVTARNSSFTYRDRAVDVQQIGRELGVRYVLEGSVRRSGQRIRITAQLIDATTGKHVWAERYDREVSDIFDVQDEISRNIVATTQTQVQISEGALFDRHDRPSLPVWALVHKGWNHIYQMTAESLAKGTAIAEEAIALDPQSGRAHQLLATSLWHDAWMGFAEDPVSARLRSRKMAERAVRLNANEELSHWILGLCLMTDREFDKAVAELERAIEINPNCSLAYGSLGTVLNHAGDPERSIVNNEIAIRSNPIDPSIFYRYNGLALSHLLLKRIDTAVTWAAKTVQFEPNWYQAHIVMIMCLMEAGRVDEARRALGEYRTSFPDTPITEFARLPFQNPAHSDYTKSLIQKIERLR